MDVHRNFQEIVYFPSFLGSGGEGEHFCRSDSLKFFEENLRFCLYRKIAER